MFILVVVLIIAALVTLVEETIDYVGETSEELWRIDSLCPKETILNFF